MFAATKTGKDIKPLQMPNAVLSLGMVLGLLADRLWIIGGPTGPGFIIWVAAVGLAAYWVVCRTNAARPGEVIAWSIVGLAAAFVLLFRTSPIVILAMGLIMIVVSAMVVMQKNDKSLRETTVADHLISFARVPAQCIVATISILGKVDIGSSLFNPRFRAVSRGIFLASPLLLVFTLLFASADAQFNRYALEVLDIFSPDTLRHLAIIIVLGWAATGLLAGVSEKHFLVNRKKKTLLNLGTDDTAVFMGLLVTLFLVFVYLQLGYLFGGRQTIETTFGLTLAEYARRGFFELLAVAGLTLILLITIAETNCNKRVFRPLAAMLVACVMVILASAGQRMGLYVIEFGLSIDRITALSVMVWLALGLILFVSTVLRGRIKDFAAGLTVSGVIIVFLFALANPAALVASVNIDSAIDNNREVDILYLLSLGPDAVPTLVDRIDSLPSSARCLVARNTLEMWYAQHGANNVQLEDWRWWNASRAAAQKAVSKESLKLTEIVSSC